MRRAVLPLMELSGEASLGAPCAGRAEFAYITPPPTGSSSAAAARTVKFTSGAHTARTAIARESPARNAMGSRIYVRCLPAPHDGWAGPAGAVAGCHLLPLDAAAIQRGY